MNIKVILPTLDLAGENLKLRSLLDPYRFISCSPHNFLKISPYSDVSSCSGQAAGGLWTQCVTLDFYFRTKPGTIIKLMQFGFYGRHSWWKLWGGGQGGDLSATLCMCRFWTNIHNNDSITVYNSIHFGLKLLASLLTNLTPFVPPLFR
jgi:hypothetical protein